MKRRARTIAEVTHRGLMPPWLPDMPAGTFVGERDLTAEEVSLIQEWVSGGAIEGDEAKMQVKPTWLEGWKLQDPDLVVEMAEEFVVPAAGEDVYRNFVIKDALPRGLCPSGGVFTGGE